MTPERWARLRELFERALSVASKDRDAFMRAACGDDATLHRSLLALLDHHDKTGFVDVSTLTPERLVQIVLADLRAFVPGEIVANRFRVESFLDEGGMGEVYAAEDCELGGHVALKTLRPEFGRDEQMLTRFKNEVALARKITHANVSRVHDLFIHHVDLFGERRTVVCLSMELLRGETLAAHIRRKGPLDYHDAHAIASQLVAGLGAAHHAGVIHRDFKSANVVLIAGPGYLERAVIVDFGLADTFRAEHDAAAPGRIAGTPAYMAPEQIENNPLTPATDIYALGVVLFEMVSGKLPFVGSTPAETARLRLTRDAPSLTSVVPYAPKTWDDTIRACLQRDPVARPSYAAEVELRLNGRYESAADIGARMTREFERHVRGRKLRQTIGFVLVVTMTMAMWYWTTSP